MEKFDIKQSHKELYAPSSTEFTLVEVPVIQYLMLDGRGDPNTAPLYASSVEALYAVAYKAKFDSKKTLDRDFVVGPMECLWRADDVTAFVARDKDSWAWTIMISQPDWITDTMVETAVDKAASSKDLPRAHEVRLASLDEGMSAQILYLGSYDDEGPVLEGLHTTFLPEHGLIPVGDHHEIYLNDPRRTPSAKLRTILRQPVRARE